MQIVQHKAHYLDKEQVLDIHKKLSNGIQIKSTINFVEPQFIDYQKDLIEEFIADVQDVASSENYDVDGIKKTFETGLQNLNTKLKSFGDQMEKIHYFQLKWYIQLVVDNTLITSLIGDVSIMIFRNNRLYYSLHNSVETQDTKIDLFSDFVEGDLENHDEIVYVGTKVEDVIDDNDIDAIQQTFLDDNAILLNTIEKILTSRMDKKNITFLVHYVIHGSTTRASSSKFQAPQFSLGKLNKYKHLLVANKYYMTVAILSLFILFMLYHVLTQMLQITNNDVMLTDEGVLVDVTIDDIKKDIQIFQSMDPTSDEKGQKYHEIMQKLQTLETRWRWLEDVKQLKNIIQVDYNKWFNIVYISDLAQFDDPTSNYRTSLFKFNNAELNGVGTLQNIYYTNNLIIAGNKGSLLGTLNDSVRGTLIDFGSYEDVKNCSLNLLRNGIYCFTPDGDLFNVTNGGIETLTTTDENGFPVDIADVWVYGKANLYLFRDGFTDSGTGAIFVSRYRNLLGSQIQYEEWSDSPVLEASLPAGVSFKSWFASFAIDGSFLTWSRDNGQLYQFRREGTSTLLSARVVPMLGWDKTSKKYSADVKVIATVNSRYVYLFDRINQTFTIYDTAPNKDKDVYNRDFALRYLFRFMFALEGAKVIDVAIPENLGNRPELYLLTTQGVHRIKLSDFIDSLAAGALKQVRTTGN